MAQDKNTPVSPKNASEKEKKMLQIRGDLQGYLYRQDWSAIDGMIRGVLYADHDLAVSLIVWKNKWQQEEQTLLHDILTMPTTDPPMSLLKMVVDIAPHVLWTEDKSGNLPLHVAIYSNNASSRSLEIIRFLVQADTERNTLSPITFWQAIRRGDPHVVRYLLTFQECAKALVIPVNGRLPLYYSSKNAEITPLLKLMIQATSDEMNKRSCCFYRSIENCADYMYDADAILEMARQEKLYCTNHLIDVARRRDTLASKRAAAAEENGAATEESSDPEQATTKENSDPEPAAKEENGDPELVNKTAAEENGDAQQATTEENGDSEKD